jgi:hypothetical protein
MNDQAGKNENNTAAAIVATNKGDTSSLPTLTTILICTTFQTAGQLLKTMAEANLWFHEGGIISINHGEDNISTLTLYRRTSKI